MAMTAMGTIDATTTTDDERWALDRMRPKTRGDCARVPRPCPFVGCRMNLALDALHASVVDGHRSPTVMRRRLAVLDDFDPSMDPSRPSCALDVADDGPTTLADVGAALGVSREMARQIEAKAVRKMAVRLPHVGVDGPGFPLGELRGAGGYLPPVPHEGALRRAPRRRARRARWIRRRVRSWWGILDAAWRAYAGRAPRDSNRGGPG